MSELSFLFYCFWYIKAVSQVWLVHRTHSEFCAIMLITNCLQTMYVGFSSKYVVAEIMLSLIFQWTQVRLILEICTSFLVCSCWQYLGWIICLESNLVLFFIHDEWEGAKRVNFSPKKVSSNPCLSDILIYQPHISSIPWDRWIVLLTLKEICRRVYVTVVLIKDEEIPTLPQDCNLILNIPCFNILLQTFMDWSWIMW